MRPQDPNVIHTQGLSKRFGAVQALQGVDQAVPKNSIFGFLGPNGAGKTTLMKVLLGLIRPTAGSGTIFGHDIVGEIGSQRPNRADLNGKDGVVYKISVKGEADGLGQRLGQIPWVSHASASQHNGGTDWQVSVRDEAAAEARLLRYVLADTNLRVVEFSRKKYELEEVFMAVVKGDKNEH